MLALQYMRSRGPLFFSCELWLNQVVRMGAGRKPLSGSQKIAFISPDIFQSLYANTGAIDAALQCELAAKQ